MTDETSTILECDCGVHLLRVGIDDEPFMAINLAMYHYGKKGRSLRYRLRHIWNILTRGDVFTDQIVLNPDEAKKLADFLNNHLIPNTKND